MLSQYKNYKIFLDTCSIMTNKKDGRFDKFLNIVMASDVKLIVASQVVEELKKHQDNDGLSSLKKLQMKGIVEIYGDKNDGIFADQVFDYIFSKFKTKYNLLLITQDYELAKMISAKNYQKAVKGKKIICKKIAPDGGLEDFRLNKKRSKIAQDQGIKISASITTIQDIPMLVSSVPNDGDFIVVQGTRIQLLRELAQGGEGSIFETNAPEFVVKIYKKEKITQRRYEKIKLMVEKQVKCDGICYPIAIAYNENDDFVGYLMPKARGVEISKSIFKKPLFIRKLPDWTRQDLVELCITILEKIIYLHQHNIILGDINPANILILSSTEVYFVDTDSYQIGEFPCPVGTEHFTASEIQGKNYADFLRSKGNEYFAIATLLFMIMLPGKPPYSQQDGASACENIKNASFPYPFGESSTKKAPDGVWKFMWSHLPYKIKEAFYETFQQGGKYFEESKRLSAQKWLVLFREYLELLRDNKLQEQDSMSNDIYPVRHKKRKDVVYMQCRICKQEDQEQYIKGDICLRCRDKKRKQDEQIVATYACKECHRTFGITHKEHSFFVQKGLNVPKRCPSCRKSKSQDAVGDTNSYGIIGFFRKFFS